MESVQYGDEMKQHFNLSPDFTFTNHGSWGLSPNIVVKEKCSPILMENVIAPIIKINGNTGHVQRRLGWFAPLVELARRHMTEITILERIESNVDKFFRWDKDSEYSEIVDIVARFVRAKPENVVMVDNATSGVNAVVKSIRLKPGDAILVNNETYPAVRKACEAASNRVEGTECQILQIDIPIESEASVVKLYDDYLTNHPEVRLAIVDYISSGSALLFPVHRLVEVCRRHNVLVLIDGAHAPGHLDINVEELKADFFTGNIHKWCYTPRSIALLWIAPEHQSWVSPILTSSSYGDQPSLEFMNQGTKDYSSLLSVRAGIQFYKDVGGFERIHPYTSDLSTRAAAMLATAWGTHLLPVPETMRAPNMKSIKLPPLEYESTIEGSILLMKKLFDDYKVVVCVCLTEGELYCRISAQIYNKMADYEVLRDAVLAIAKK